MCTMVTTSARHPPQTQRLYMKSAVFNGHWYLMGGEHFKICVYYASLDSLL